MDPKPDGSDLVCNGKLVGDMTREELLQALVGLFKEYEYFKNSYYAEQKSKLDWMQIAANIKRTTIKN